MSRIHNCLLGESMSVVVLEALSMISSFLHQNVIWHLEKLTEYFTFSLSKNIFSNWILLHK